MSAAELERAFSDFVLSELEIEPFGDKRLVCDTPLYYPEGESVAVFVLERDEDNVLEVTDYGEGYAHATARPGSKRAAIRQAAQMICASLGLEFSAGRVSTFVRVDRFADAAWRVATASARIAEAVTFAQVERTRDEDMFTDEVEGAFRSRRIEVERSPKLLGDSGHEYRPSLFVPNQHLVVEPIAPEIAWQRATSVYAEFGDLSQANGYRLMAVVDDRSATPSEKVVRLLNQVGDVAYYSRREGWLARFGGGNGNG